MIQTNVEQRFRAQLGLKDTANEVGVTISMRLTVNDGITTVTARKPERVTLTFFGNSSRAYDFTPGGFEIFAALIRDAAIALAGHASQEDQR